MLLQALRAHVHLHLGFASFAEYVERLFGLWATMERKNAFVWPLGSKLCRGCNKPYAKAKYHGATAREYHPSRHARKRASMGRSISRQNHPPSRTARGGP